MSSALGDLRFPLEDRFLARVRVSSNRFEDWKAIAQKEIDAVLANPRSWYYRPNDLKQAYRPVYEQDAIRGFIKGVDDNSGRKDMLSLAHLEFSLEDFAFGYHAVTTADQRAVYAQIYGETFLDGAILKLVEGPSERDPFYFVGLKWLAFASPAPAILNPRDHVFFEFTGTAQDSAGHKVLFVYKRSFPLQGDEISEPDKGCTRTHFYRLSLFRMEGGGVLMHGVSQFDPAPEAPSWVTTRVITEMFDSIKNFVGLADARAIASAGMIKHASTPKMASDNKACVVCKKKFSMLRSRHGCRSCGQSMCKHCVTGLTFFNDEALFSSVPVTLSENFCMNCIKHARSQRHVDHLSASLTKTNISLLTMGGGSDSRLKNDFVSTTSSHGSQPRAHREGVRQSIEQQVGMAHSESSSDATGSNRSLPRSLYSAMAADSPASTSYASSSGTSRSATQNSMLFEQMNASISQQQELLMVIQQERAKLQARQHFAPAPVVYDDAVAAPLIAYDQVPASPLSIDDSGDHANRFEVLS